MCNGNKNVYQRKHAPQKLVPAQIRMTNPWEGPSMTERPGVQYGWPCSDFGCRQAHMYGPALQDKYTFPGTRPLPCRGYQPAYATANCLF